MARAVWLSGFGTQRVWCEPGPRGANEKTHFEEAFPVIAESVHHVRVSHQRSRTLRRCGTEALSPQQPRDTARDAAEAQRMTQCEVQHATRDGRDAASFFPQG